MPEIKFREFTAKDSEQFKALNIEWLKKYFEVEPIDERVLCNPRSEILDSGGFIFMAEIKDEVIGTFAFIKKRNQIYEFSKMAIDPKFRNKGYGRVLLLFNNKIIKKLKKHSFLVCPKKTTSFYLKYNWKILTKNSFKMTDHKPTWLDYKKNLYGMIYNLDKKITKKILYSIN